LDQRKYSWEDFLKEERPQFFRGKVSFRIKLIVNRYSFPQTLAGVASCCGFALPKITVHEANRDTQLLALSGYEDENIPYNIARASYQGLKLDYDIEVKLYTDGVQEHEMNLVQWTNLVAWIKQMLQ
jgi:predicted esterase